MSPDVLTTPYVLQPGQVVRTEASYNTSQPYAGVMSVLVVVMANFSAKPECNIDFAGFIQVSARVS